MEIHIHIHNDNDGLPRLEQLIHEQGETLMGRLDDLKALIDTLTTNQAATAANVVELDGDIHEINDKLTELIAQGITVEGAAELQAKLSAAVGKSEELVASTRAAADVVPEPTEPPVVEPPTV